MASGSNRAKRFSRLSARFMCLISATFQNETAHNNRKGYANVAANVTKVCNNGNRILTRLNRKLTYSTSTETRCILKAIQLKFHNTNLILLYIFEKKSENFHVYFRLRFDFRTHMIFV